MTEICNLIAYALLALLCFFCAICGLVLIFAIADSHDE
jgi:hypothetical protein